MLDWSAGPLRAADALSIPMNEGISCVEDPPETPAHIFALRAFKTAIFGTPHPEQQKTTIVSQELVKTVQSRKDEPSRHGSKDQDKPQRGAGCKLELEHCSSPAKGILLTPGAGTSRRKNVSFMQLDGEAQEREVELEDEEPIPGQDDSPTRPSHKRDDRPRPSSFTKTLIQLSKQRADDHLESKKFTDREKSPSATAAIDKALDMNSEPELDHTVDLSQPRSQSGKHWKQEYEQYYHRSAREMKKMIRYGQNVKSFAVKKDFEASGLAEELRVQLAKVKAMEARSARMAKRLSIAQSQDHKSEGNHARLISELAQQTALVSKYKQRLEQYPRTLHQKSSGPAICDGEQENQIMRDMKDDSPDQSQQTSLRAQIETLEQAAKTAEARAQTLEIDNNILKASLSRVKQEITSYNSRRQEKEERLKRRGEKHKIAKEAIEAQLAQLQTELRLPKLKSQTNALVGKEPALVRSDGPNIPNRSKASAVPTTRPSPRKETRKPNASISPRKRRQENVAFDIWTQPDDTLQSEQAEIDAEALCPPTTEINGDIHKALQDIDLNLVPGGASVLQILKSTSPQGKPPSSKSKDPIGYEDGLPVFTATSSTAISERVPRYEGVTDVPVSSPAKLQRPDGCDNSPLFGSYRSRVGRSAAVVSTAGVRRTSSMGSVRSTPAMTAERRAAAQERLRDKGSGRKLSS